MMIFISAGHNEKAQGASYKDVTEYILTTKWVALITTLLGDACVRVPNGRLKHKVSFINRRATRNDIAIEIHFNSAKKWRDLDGDGVVDADELIAVGRGSETLYMPNSKKGKAAASIMQSQLGHLMQPDRGAKEGYYQMNPAKGPDYFLRATKCTALIVEPEFIDNLTELNQNMNAACHVIAAAALEINNNL